MTSVRYDSAGKLIQTWHKCEALLKDSFTATLIFLKEHRLILQKNGNSAPNELVILPLKEMLENLLQLKKDFEKCKTQFETIQLDESHKKETLIDNANTNIQRVNDLIFKLSQVIADKYMFLQKGVKKVKEKASFVKEAFHYAQMANEIFSKRNLPDPTFTNFMEHVDELYYSYYLKNDVKDPIQTILIAARWCDDKEIAFEKFDAALKLAIQKKDTEKQFLILWEQAENYIERLLTLNHLKLGNFSLKDIKEQYAIFQKACHSYVEAAKIQLSHPEKILKMILCSRGICVDLFRYSKHLVELSKMSVLSNKFDFRENILKSAQELAKYAHDLAININQEFDEAEGLQDLIHNASQQLANDKIKLVQKRDDRVHLKKLRELEEAKQKEMEAEKFAAEKMAVEKKNLALKKEQLPIQITSVEKLDLNLDFQTYMDHVQETWKAALILLGDPNNKFEALAEKLESAVNHLMLAYQVVLSSRNQQDMQEFLGLGNRLIQVLGSFSNFIKNLAVYFKNNSETEINYLDGVFEYLHQIRDQLRIDHEATNELQKIDSPLPHEVKNIYKRAYFHTVFYNDKVQKKASLQRCMSLDSIFDEVEISIKKSNRREFGR